MPQGGYPIPPAELVVGPFGGESARLGSDTIALTHGQIARYMGSAREVVSRMLKYFASEGIVEVSRGGVTILDRKRLRELAL